MAKKTKKTQKKTNNIFWRLTAGLKSVWTKIYIRIKKLLARRPHRSFRLTRRRDYKRSLKLPGYWSFTNHVRATLWKSRRLFGGLILVSITASIVISGFGAQDAYNSLSETIRESSDELFKGNLDAVSQAGLLLLGTVSTGLSPDLTEAQTVLGTLALFFGWLASIWLLRNTLAGHKPKLRDGLYNSGSPVLATILVGFVTVVQMLPAAIAVIVYSAAQTSGLLENGVSAMLVWCSVALLGLLSIYWLSSSFIAMIIVTLPGMYPMRAIKAAGDLVVGRRLRIIFRLAWLLLMIIATWAIIVIPIILFDSWIKSLLPIINWLPLVPLTVIAMGALTLVFASSYVYLLYRRIVDDDAAPA
jgi:hypothetical protein